MALKQYLDRSFFSLGRYGKISSSYLFFFYSYFGEKFACLFYFVDALHPCQQFLISRSLIIFLASNI